MAFGGPAFNNGGLHRPQADINVTPLVDVMLVLLIVFMITAPMLAQGLKVNLPQAKSAQPVNPKDPIVVTVSQNGKAAIGQDEMEIPQLIEALQAKMEGDNTRVIQLRADKDANYGAFITVVDQLATNGMIHIALISDPKAKGANAASAASNAPAASDAMPSASIASAQPRAASAQ